MPTRPRPGVDPRSNPLTHRSAGGGLSHVPLGFRGSAGRTTGLSVRADAGKTRMGGAWRTQSSMYEARGWASSPVGGMNRSSWSVIFELMRDFRQRRSDEAGIEAEFWGRGNDSFKARVATGIVLIGAVAGIAGLTLLARGLV